VSTPKVTAQAWNIPRISIAGEKTNTRINAALNTVGKHMSALGRR
jgi:hypothetical protein